MRLRSLAALSALVACLAAAAPASAQSLLEDFKGDGRINPCQYTDQQLRNGLDNLPPDIEQYAPGLAEQLGAGRGGCGGGGSAPQATETEGVPVPASGGGPPAADIPAPPAPEVTKRSKLAGVESPPIPTVTAVPTGNDAPGWLLPLLLLGGAGFGLYALGRYLGWSGERFTRPLGASFGEAGGRMADSLAGVRDSLRAR